MPASIIDAMHDFGEANRHDCVSLLRHRCTRPSAEKKVILLLRELLTPPESRVTRVMLSKAVQRRLPSSVEARKMLVHFNIGSICGAPIRPPQKSEKN